MTSMGQAVRTERTTYDVSSLADDRIGEIPAGSNLLIAGPSMMGKADLALTALTERQRHEQHAVFVSSDQNADRLLDQVEALGVSVDLADVYVVDCSGTPGRGAFEETANIEHISSPSDLTGIGIGIAKCTNEIGDDVRNGLGVGVLSLSTLHQYASEDRVFNFAHVMTGRIAAAGYLGIWTLDTTSHDEQTINTIRGQFDYVAELHEAESGEREMRILRGRDDWRTWEPL